MERQMIFFNKRMQSAPITSKPACLCANYSKSGFGQLGLAKLLIFSYFQK